MLFWSVFMKVLYLEDEQAHVHLVELYTKSNNYDLLHANNVAQAQEYLLASPDMILVDAIIRDTRQGLEFVQYARSQGVRVPIIVVTALSGTQDHQACQRAGADAVLVKPITIDHLEDLFDFYRNH
jgi:DNA-binding response OmpR family regulator